jgi:hypothetical protein
MDMRACVPGAGVTPQLIGTASVTDGFAAQSGIAPIGQTVFEEVFSGQFYDVRSDNGFYAIAYDQASNPIFCCTMRSVSEGVYERWGRIFGL